MILLTEDDVDRSERFYARFGGGAVFVGRLLPGVRSFIALPAGVAGMPRARFHIATFAGSLPWCLGLAWVGMTLGNRWQSDPRIHSVFSHADAIVVAALAAAIAWFVWTRWRRDTPA